MFHVLSLIFPVKLGNVIAATTPMMVRDSNISAMVKAKPSGATKQALLAKSRACDDKSVELLAQKRAVAFIARRSTSVEHLVNKALGR